MRFFQLLLPAPGQGSGELNEGQPGPQAGTAHLRTGVTHSSGLHLTAYPVGVSRPLWVGGGSFISPPLGKNVPTSSKALRSGPSPSPETGASIISGQGASCHNAITSPGKGPRAQVKCPHSVKPICSRNKREKLFLLG